MGIGKAVQWAEHISFGKHAKRFGMKESIGQLLS